MKWWYENETDMPKITLVDYDKEGKPFDRDVVVPTTAEEARQIQEEIMDNWNYLNMFGCNLPKKQEMGVSDRVVVAVEGCPYVQTGYYDYDQEAWFIDSNRYPVRVYAWMAAKPPKPDVMEA